MYQVTAISRALDNWTLNPEIGARVWRLLCCKSVMTISRKCHFFGGLSDRLLSKKNKSLLICYLRNIDSDGCSVASGISRLLIKSSCRISRCSRHLRTFAGKKKHENTSVMREAEKKICSTPTSVFGTMDSPFDWQTRSCLPTKKVRRGVPS